MSANQTLSHTTSLKFNIQFTKVKTSKTVLTSVNIMPGNRRKFNKVDIVFISFFSQEKMELTYLFLKKSDSRVNRPSPSPKTLFYSLITEVFWRSKRKTITVHTKRLLPYTVNGSLLPLKKGWLKRSLKRPWAPLLSFIHYFELFYISPSPMFFCPLYCFLKSSSS